MHIYIIIYYMKIAKRSLYICSWTGGRRGLVMTKAHVPSSANLPYNQRRQARGLLHGRMYTNFNDICQRTTLWAFTIWKNAALAVVRHVRQWNAQVRNIAAVLYAFINSIWVLKGQTKNISQINGNRYLIRKKNGWNVVLKNWKTPILYNVVAFAYATTFSVFIFMFIFLFILFFFFQCMRVNCSGRYSLSHVTCTQCLQLERMGIWIQIFLINQTLYTNSRVFYR